MSDTQGVDMIISLVMQKGGASKSTLAVNLAAWMASKGMDFTLVDADPQQNIVRFGERRCVSMEELEESLRIVDKDIQALEEKIAANGSSDALDVEHYKLTRHKQSIEEFIATRQQGELCNIPIITLRGETLDKAVREQATKYDHIIIDTGGRDAVEARKALIVSDVVLMPIIPSQFDVDALEKTLESFETARHYNDKLLGVLVPSKVSPNIMVRDGEDLILHLQEKENKYEGLGLYKGRIHERAICKKSISLGLSTFEMLPSDAKDKATAEFDTLFTTVFQAVQEQYNKQGE